MNVRVELIKLNIRACVSNSTPGGPLSYSKTPAWKFQVFEFDGRESEDGLIGHLVAVFVNGRFI